MYDISKDKRIWQDKKQRAVNASARLVDAGMVSRGGVMGQCAETIYTAECEHCHKRKVIQVNFCKDRLCPVCSWRRSLVLVSRLLPVVSKLVDTGYIFLTLTVRNCLWGDLDKVLGLMGRAWQRFNQSAAFRRAVRGYVRSVEITRGNDGLAHPHIHVLCAVDKKYFRSSLYLTQADICKLWRRSLRVDYDPVCDVRGVKDVRAAVVEVVKYIAKDADWVRLSDTELRLFCAAIRRRRLLGFGGVLRVGVDVENLTSEELLLMSSSPDGVMLCPDCGRSMQLCIYTWNCGDYVLQSRHDCVSVICQGGVAYASVGGNHKKELLA